MALLDQGKPALAAQLAEWAVRAAPDSAGAHVVRAAVHRRLAELGPSLTARGISPLGSQDVQRAKGHLTVTHAMLRASGLL